MYLPDRETNPPTRNAPLLVLTAPPITTIAQDKIQQPAFHCLSHPDSSMTVLDYTHTPSDTTARCIGLLTTITHLPHLSTPRDDAAVPAE